ncbi:hypothetical protein HYH02_006122 [Chlamydomonas schloesseri]|uniref:Uncharacterized protein n=1 Tax=Chlamydomonas schloesseri TaxID=2026947 RepID=A0A835WJF3_9CHLO|nr:hypothetical protein HYH02_006122 [Chlamydomonas schloesseri]|eukprot:KAG2448768.1 hypothetical protein HYH02_006122 [Chlamydomonas schloesseri]
MTRVALLLLALSALAARSYAAQFGVAATESEDGDYSCNWARGGKRCCGTLKNPGASHGWREDETDHCFPASASDHMVCCVDIQSVDNEVNEDDPAVAHHNPLSGPIRRNSDASSYSWCTCSVSICEKQLKGRVAWVGRPGRT